MHIGWRKIQSHFFSRKFDLFQKNFMLPEFWKVDSDKENNVKYFNHREREKYKLTLENGKFYTADKTLYHTGNPQLSGLYAVTALYVIDEEGNFYATTKNAVGDSGIKHSSLLSGRPVLCAGYLSIINGELKSISNCSGHYRPSLGALIKTLYLLRKHGISLDSFSVKYEGEGSLRPKIYSTAMDFIRTAPYPTIKKSSFSK